MEKLANYLRDHCSVDAYLIVAYWSNVDGLSFVIDLEIHQKDGVFKKYIGDNRSNTKTIKNAITKTLKELEVYVKHQKSL